MLLLLLSLSLLLSLLLLLLLLLCTIMRQELQARLMNGVQQMYCVSSDNSATTRCMRAHTRTHAHARAHARSATLHNRHVIHTGIYMPFSEATPLRYVVASALRANIALSNQ